MGHGLAFRAGDIGKGLINPSSAQQASLAAAMAASEYHGLATYCSCQGYVHACNALSARTTLLLPCRLSGFGSMLQKRWLGLLCLRDT